MDVKEVVGLKLVFNDVTIGNVDILVTPDWVKWLWTSPDQLNITIRVGKVSGIEVSCRVSGMPEMPGTKPGFGRPKLPKAINLEI